MTIEEYRKCESARLEANRRRMEDDGVNFVDIYNCSECHDLRQIYN